MLKVKKLLIVFIIVMILSMLSFNVMGTSFALEEKIELTDASLIEFIEENFNYNGEPKYIEKLKYNGTILVEGKDFNALYENNINASASGFMAKITIIGVGRCSGTLIKEFEILPKALNLTEITIKEIVLLENGIANNEPIVLDDKKSLILDKDYVISYLNNDKLGEATLIINGKENYFGEVKKTFEIRQNNLTVKELPFQDKYVQSILLNCVDGFKDNMTYSLTKKEKSEIDMTKRIKYGYQVKGNYSINVMENDNSYNFESENYVYLKIKLTPANKSLKGGFAYTMLNGEVERHNIALKDGYFQVLIKANSDIVLVGKYSLDPIIIWSIIGGIILLIILWMMVLKLKRAIIFKENGGFPVKDIIKVRGTKVKLPTCQRSGYRFNGWYLDQKLTVPFKSHRMPGYDVILYASWIKINGRK